MTGAANLDTLAERHAASLGDRDDTEGTIRTAGVIGSLLGAPDHVDRLEVAQLCRQIDVRRRLSASYGPAWKKLDVEMPAEPATLSGAAALLLLQARTATDDGWDLKCLNSALKVLDLESELPDRDLLVAAAEELATPDSGRSVAPRHELLGRPSPPSTPGSTPLTVLAWEGPQARAYLVALARAGYEIERVILVVHDEKAKGLDTPRRMKKAEARQDRSENFHPRDIRRRHGDLVSAILGAMSVFVDDPVGQVAEMYDHFDYDAHAPVVDRVVANRLRDETIHEALARVAPGAVMFTGGGIMPAPPLQIEGLRLLHVHPGLLPDIRGADGMLWSLLVRARPAMSCFYMSPGLDTGDLITGGEFEPLAVDLGSHRPNDQTLYRALFSYIDPLLRARLLVHEVLQRGPKPEALPAGPQDEEAGVTFHFLHPRLRRRALELLFPT